MTEFVFGHDAEIAAWMFAVSNSRPMQFNMAVGIVDGDVIVGGVMFTGWNGSDVEVHYTGPGHLTRRTVRLIMGLAAMQFDVNRLTIHTRKKSMARGVTKLGAVYECTVRRLYGPTDAAEHAGRRYTFFRETIEKLAGIRTQELYVKKCA